VTEHLEDLCNKILPPEMEILLQSSIVESKFRVLDLKYNLQTCFATGKNE